MRVREKRFESFFKDSVYLFYKNHLYNFLVRRHVVRKNLRGSRFQTILELGCGTSPMLDTSVRAVQTDLSWQALSFLRLSSKNGKDLRPVACDATHLPFRDEAFDCVICSEVIEHIEEDELALQEIARIVKRGGELILTCPLHQKYFGFDDRLVGHYRRYELPELTNRLTEMGFQDCRSNSVLGLLEKQVMDKVAKLWVFLKGRKGEDRPLGLGTQILAWLFLPFYLLINYALAAAVTAQAQITSLEKTVTVCLRCRKTT